MAQTELGIGIIGTGFGQKIHIPGFQAHHRTNVAAVYHRDRAKAEAIAARHGIPHVFTSVDELVQCPAVDGVSLSTPPFLHAEMGQAVLRAGKHLLLEKPTALSVDEARHLLALSQQTGAIAALDFEFRFVPAWQRLAELLAEGVVGQKRFIAIDWLVSGRGDPNRPWNWYAQKDLGGGALGAIGSHVFDYLSWLFGPATRLCGQLSTAIATRPDPVSGEPKPVDADDTCRIMLDLADGTPCQIALSAVTYQGRGHWLEIYGDRGTLVLGSDNQSDYVHGFKLWLSENGGPLTEVEIPDRLQFPQTYDDGRLAPFIRVVDHWVQCIDHGKPAAPSLQEGVYSQLLMDLTHASHQAGAWVDVPSS
ncbi:Gfo/Idh/MocA family oxidoreductase [Leptolyngbya sp. CCY15150]|uniref:Gfo/Idh/MocA family protein n=1 Tax=Leptolyngbya sp. CCY15150 TaxID=2767772 RepID=UPI0019512356|nr:Gfo/Idh/MocA family oxidoreductase [Leptolyngbya sp. CCY15150]